MVAKPFKPLRIFLSGGKSHDVPNRAAAWVTQNHVETGTNLDSAGLAENVTRCAIIHIARVEEPQPA